MSVVASGTLLGHYEVRSLLGVGGMGEVYLAQDQHLGRPVALKILSPDVARDQSRMQRFMQEAKATSALNHPNILTIYEVGHSQDIYFIAAEFINGEMLRERMSKGRIKLSEALEVAVQVATALAAAHAAGIVHRDIKPENIMLRPDGYAKVLDFGIAKLTEHGADDAEAPTMFRTQPGTVMGTVSYMAPEQARGLSVDHRADIWSLGVVLYEMLTGTTPFDGPTISHVMVAILERDYLPVTHYAPTLPPELNQIIYKALCKDCEGRYQTIGEFLVDLKNLKHRLEFEVELERSQHPHNPDALTASTQRFTAPPLAEAPTAVIEVAQATSPVTGHLTSKTTPYKNGATIIVLALIIAASILAFGVYKLLDTRKAAAAFERMKISRLTTTGKAKSAAITPDGKYVVYVEEDGRKQSLKGRQVATASNVTIVPPAEVQYKGLTFSHDGDYLYYVVSEKSNASGALYQVPALGGENRKIIENVGSPITLSPNGKQLAFVRDDLSLGGRVLITVNSDGTNEKLLASPKYPDFLGLEGPAWSPDGKVIACSAGSYTGGFYMNVVGFQVEDGTQTSLTSRKWWSVGRVAWLEDGSGLVVAAREQASGMPRQLLHLSYPEGEVRSITSDLNDYGGVSLTADSSTLVSVQSEQLSNIWVAPDGDDKRAKQITSSKYERVSGLAWTPDGKIVYASNANNSHDIWIVDENGTSPKQLTMNAGNNRDPSVSPDGRHIVFGSNRAGAFNIWRMNLDGTNPKQLTTGSSEWWPSCSPDGQWVVYTATVSGKVTVWKVPIDSGSPTQLTDSYSFRPVVSPDGKLIACYYRNEQAGSAGQVAVLPFEGGSPIKLLGIPQSSPYLVDWTSDMQALRYIVHHGGISNIWSQPIDGSSPKQLTDFKENQIFGFDWSQDNKQLAYARGAVTNDVVIIKASN